MFAQLKTRFVTWRTYRETVRQLGWLDQHMLADAGIAPGDIKAVAKARAARQAL